MRRNILHVGRGIWYHAQLFHQRCESVKLREYVKSVETEVGRLLVFDRPSGSIQVCETDECLKLIESPFQEFFKPLKGQPQRKMHYLVQKQIIGRCEYCVATELPLRHPKFSGFIDVVIDKDGKIVIWDYKPGAKKVNAYGQVSFYCALMSELIGEPISKFKCGWFDEKDAWLGVPAFDFEELCKKC